METITIPKEKYEELLRKAQQLAALQNQRISQKQINSVDDLPTDLIEDMEILEESSDEDLVNWEKKHLALE